jgi:hypothetical protein
LLSALVLILFAGLTIATVKLKETGFWGEEEYEDFSSFDNLVKKQDEEVIDTHDESSD